MRTHGLSRKAARRQAIITFGGVERVKSEGRDARGVSVVENLARDAWQAGRRLMRDPSFSLPAVASIGLGVGVAAAVFALVNGVLLRPLPYPEPDRLVTLTHTATGAEFPVDGLSQGMFLHYRNHNRVFEEIGAYTERDRPLTDPDLAPEHVRTAEVSPSLFTVLRAKPHLGRLLIEEDAIPGTRSGVVISHALWVRRYGADPNIIGREIEIGRGRTEVMGVMEPGFDFPHAETQVWRTSWRRSSVSTIEGFYMNGVARLRPGVSIAVANDELARLIGMLPQAYPGLTTEALQELDLRPVVESLQETLVGKARPALRLLAATAIFLLLITWANATNLCLARAERRSREVAVVRALGSRETQVARRFFLEGSLLATVGSGLGLALAYTAVGLRFGFDPDGIPRLREVDVDGAVLVLALGLGVSTAALLGFVSYLHGRPAHVANALAGAGGRMTADARGQIGRRLLVAGQLALALTLLIGSALMASSFWKITQMELGFDPTGAITFHLPTPPAAYGDNYYHEQVRIHDQLLRRLRAIPGVTAAEAGNIAGFPLTPVTPDYEKGIAAAERAGDGEASWPYGLFSFATPGYFDAMGIPMLRGRTFRAEDTGAEEHGVVLSRSLARALFGERDPIGQRVRWATPSTDPDYRIVGVVGDVPSGGMMDGPSPVIYFPNLHPPRADTITGTVHDYVPSNEMYVIRTSASLAMVLPSIRDAIHQVDPKLVMTSLGTLEELVDDSLAETRLTMLLLLAGAMTALALGVIGIYGLLAYTIGQRTAEFGVRIALGADPSSVVGMVVRQGATLALIGIVVVGIAAAGLTRFLDALLYEVSPSDPAAFIGMAMLLFLIALAASYIPARRAARIEPARALKVG
ncbi:MAG: FtsX-like permease family protein [Gemmatimonas sp.]|nr:FtsX-like permease family protein [Gemmatimonas sp.]